MKAGLRTSESGYRRFGGSKTTAHDLMTIFDTMEANSLFSQERLLTGTFIIPPLFNL